MARQEIDLTTPQPNGKMGEPTKSAWEKVNDMTAEIYDGLEDYSQLSGRNMLINCGIPVNQRGFAGGNLAAGVYGYDMWKAGSGGCNVSINPSNGVFTHNSGTLIQVIESPISAWGQPLTISVENPSGPISVSVGGASGTIPAGTGRLGVTVTPSGSGNMTVQLSASGVTYSRPQLERGSSASRFEFCNLSLELIKCKRYFEVVRLPSLLGAAYSNVDIAFGLRWDVQKVSAPSVTINSLGVWVGNNSNGTNVAIVISDPSIYGCRGDVTSFTNSISAGFAYDLRGTSFYVNAWD